MVIFLNQIDALLQDKVTTFLKEKYVLILK